MLHRDVTATERGDNLGSAAGGEHWNLPFSLLGILPDLGQVKSAKSHSPNAGRRVPQQRQRYTVK